MLLEMRCSNCGFTLDPVNESQQVCPACGDDPVRRVGVEYDSENTAAVADVASMADQVPAPIQSVEELPPVDSDVDYISYPELDLVMADAEVYLSALLEGPFLVAGNQLIN